MAFLLFLLRSRNEPAHGHFIGTARSADQLLRIPLYRMFKAGG